MTGSSDHSDHETAQNEAHEAAGPLDLLLPQAAMRWAASGHSSPRRGLPPS